MPIAAPPRTAVHSSHRNRPADTPDLELLRTLQQQMLETVTGAGTLGELLAGLAHQIDSLAEPITLLYFQRSPEGSFSEVIQVRPDGQDLRQGRHRKHLAAACQTAAEKGGVVTHQQVAPARTTYAAAVAVRGREPDGVAMICPTESPHPSLVLMLQLVASKLVLWHSLADERAGQSDARQAAALVELLDQVTAARDLRQACFSVVAELPSFLGCERAAIGMHHARNKPCRLIGVSGVARIDRRSSKTLAIEAALDETVLRGDVTAWPPRAEQKQALLAHKHLCSVEGAQAAISIPLRGSSGPVGALLLVGDEQLHVDQVDHFLRAAEGPIANALAAVRRIEGNWLQRAARSVSGFVASWRGSLGILASGLFCAAMAMPLPYKVHCDCQVEPVTRRFVSAPFEGVLESSRVRPGDVVQAGDILAEMDGRELRWKRASVEADRNQAIKRRDAAQASHDYTDQRIAQLEIERLDLELQLLDYRTDHLQIRSPIDGIVAAGDLERAEGAPLEKGQSLFEIAPLDRMVVEVAVPDAESPYVTAAQPIQIKLDAYADHTWNADLDRVQPRSEIRDEANVFIAEVKLENGDNLLRPGMKGRAKIVTAERPLGWILFHRPWEFFRKIAAW